MAKRNFIVVGLFAVVVCVIAWRGYRPEKPPASVTFLSYTNDAAGTRCATFVVTNLKSFVVRRQAGYWIELRTSEGQTNHAGLWFSSGKDLDAGASEIVTVPVPTNQCPWRVFFPIRTELGPVSEIIEEVRLMVPHKLPYPKSYELRGVWMESMTDENGSRVMRKQDE